MLDAESRLEDLAVSDPSLVGLEVLVLGRQVQTDQGAIYRAPVLLYGPHTADIR